MREFFERLGARRAITGAFLIMLFVGIFTATDTATSEKQPAQAGNCFAQEKNWNMKSGNVGPTVGTARFGATICLNGDGTIDSVSPYLHGGVEGLGTPAGFVWDNQGAWVVKQTATSVEVHGQAKLKECLPGLADVVCSLTTTQKFVLRYTPQYGPYLPGTEPGIWATSRWCSMTGCTPWTSAGFVEK